MRGKDICECEHVKLWRDAAVEAWDELARLHIDSYPSEVRRAYDSIQAAVDAEALAMDEYREIANETGE